MREILFRGKNCFGEWVEGFYYQAKLYRYDSKLCDYITIPHPKEEGVPSDHHVVALETVGQYTGLTDKNGKKIFEGDIFRIEDDMIAVIIFKDGCFRLQVYGVCGTFTESGYDEDGGGYGVIECEPIDWYYIHDMQVIGNIHDNPELLKGGASDG